MNEIHILFFELIQISIGSRETLHKTPTEKEWAKLYQIAKKQSLVGICFAGIQRLGADAEDGFVKNGLPEMLYLTWMGMAAKIQQRNEIVNRHCIDLQKQLATDGQCSCILKGQGNAMIYPKHLCGLRQSGDIDVWIDGGRKKVIDYVQSLAHTDDVRDNHATLNLFGDTEVEAHFKPATLRNPIRNKRLQEFFLCFSGDCFAHEVDLLDGKISVPTTEFNLVYQMVHIFEHFFTEGIGLRQVMDYTFVLRDASAKGKESSEEFRMVKNVVSELGIERFASALMWVIGYVFEGNNYLKTSETMKPEIWFLKPETALWKPNEEDGRVLLNEILLSGNFGKLDERQKKMYDSRWNSFWMVHFKTLRFWRFDYWAWFWSPMWRVYGFFVRKYNGYN